jgi:pimeloyl-ACP methyl ester carboxylesterase
LDLLGIHDFTDDAEKVLNTLGAPPVVIGHSMGGMVAQLLTLRTQIKGLCLLAAVPPHGLATAATQMWMEKPDLFSQLGLVLSLGGWTSNPQQVANSLFSMATPSWERSRYLNTFQRESTRAAFEIMLPQLLRAPVPTPPTLVLGGDSDPFIPENEMEMTADFWEGEAKIIPGLPHAMMLDERWQEAALPILEWLEKI